jgi:hypothetical protein
MSLIGTGNPIGRPSDSGRERGKDNDVLTTMRQRLDHVISVDADNRDSYVKCTKISTSNNQWDEEVKKRRGSNRPALTFNLLNPIVKNIVGDYRQNKLAIKVIPSGGPSTEEIADIWAGIIRNIEVESNAGLAYTNALECAARGGFGYFRILTEYEADDAFNQKLIIQPIANPLTVYYDPSARLITREDAQYCLVTEMIGREEFKSQYPEAEAEGWDIVDMDSDNDAEWANEDDIRLCEYFTKQLVPARLVAFDNGSTVQIENDEEVASLESIGWKPIKERKANRINIKWRKCNGSHILEERMLKTKYIPIVPVLGEEVNIEGKSCLRGAVYYSVDAQHNYNYERSAAVERSALSAKAPWMVTQKMIELYRDQWDNANTMPQPYLLYRPDQEMPQGPQRIEPPSPSMADSNNAQAAAQDVQRTSGVFDAQLGEKSNVISGVGLSEQQSQGATSTFLFVDNLRTSIEYAGRIIIDWGPSIYDRERVVRTIGLEGDSSMQTINQQQPNLMMGVTEVLNDITVGKYDVVVETGPSFASRRREAVDGMMKFVQALPQQGALIADLIAKNSDWPGADECAERLKNALPLSITTDKDSPEGQQAAQQAQQQAQQQQAMQQQMLQMHIQAEQGKNQASIVKSQAEQVKAQASVKIAQIDEQKAGMDMAVERQRAASEAHRTAMDLHKAKVETVMDVHKGALDMAKTKLDMQHSAETHKQNMNKPKGENG